MDLDAVLRRRPGVALVGLRQGVLQLDNHALESAMARAIGPWFSHPGDFRQLMLNGMRQDHSCAGPGQHYANIYDHIRHK